VTLKQIEAKKGTQNKDNESKKNKKINRTFWNRISIQNTPKHVCWNYIAVNYSVRSLGSNEYSQYCPNAEQSVEKEA
jgi:hypothetical protein